jgi:hypothetical protein
MANGRRASFGQAALHQAASTGPKCRIQVEGASYMLKNLSLGDRVARLVVAAALGFLAWNHVIDGWAGYIGLGIAAYLLVTALIGFCVVYKALDFNSKEQGGTYHAGEDPFDGRGGD